jgi:hypothetical protein
MRFDRGVKWAIISKQQIIIHISPPCRMTYRQASHYSTGVNLATKGFMPFHDLIVAADDIAIKYDFADFNASTGRRSRIPFEPQRLSFTRFLSPELSIDALLSRRTHY